MEEIYNEYRKFASIGLTHDQIKDCLVVLWAFTNHEIEQAQAYVSHPQHSGANVDMNVKRKQHGAGVDKSSGAGENYWVEKPKVRVETNTFAEFPASEAKDWIHWDAAGINSTTAQDWDAVRPDMVNSPPHYTAGGIETIDYIKAKLSPEGYRGYLQGNLLKYASRIGKKGSDDAGKAAWYAQRLEML